MTTTSSKAPSVGRVMVATDRSETADRAVRWAANVASSYGAELLLLQVLPSEAVDGEPAATPARAGEELRQFAEELAGSFGRARVDVSDDPAQAILDAVEE